MQHAWLTDDHAWRCRPCRRATKPTSASLRTWWEHVDWLIPSSARRGRRPASSRSAAVATACSSRTRVGSERRGEPLGVGRGVGRRQLHRRRSRSTARGQVDAHALVLSIVHRWLLSIDADRYSRRSSIEDIDQRSDAHDDDRPAGRRRRRRPDRAGRGGPRCVERGLPPLVLEAGAVGRRRGPRSGGTCGCSRRGASSSTRPPSSCWRRPAGPRPTPTRYPTGARLGRAVPAAARRRARRPTVEVRFGTGSSAWPGAAATGSSTPAATTSRSTVHVETADRRRSGSSRAAVIDASGTWTRAEPARRRRAARARARPATADRIAYRHPRLHRPRGRALATPASTSRWPAPAPPRRTRWSGWPGSPIEHPGTTRDLAASGGRASATPSVAATTTSSPARGALGERARAAVEAGTSSTACTVVPHRRGAASADGRAAAVVASTAQRVEGVDEVVVVTGFRPDLVVALRGPARPRPGAAGADARWRR